MLTHHDQRDYEVAATEAAKAAREKLEARIAHGRERAGRVITEVLDTTPTDRIVKGAALDFVANPYSLNIHIPKHDGPGAIAEGVHRHALTQVADRVGIPDKYVSRLLEKGEFGRELLAYNLRTLYQKGNGTRYLLRSVRGELRGFLSDSYRRMDSRPALEAFAEACKVIGAEPTEAYQLDTKFTVTAMLPYVFEPVPHEVTAFGVTYGNSDYGDGAYSLRFTVLRLWCTNMAIAEEVLRKIHLGKRLSEDVAFSEQTYRLDSETMASMVKDLVGQTLSPDNVRRYTMAVQQAHADKLTPAQLKDLLIKRNLLKDEQAAVVEKFNSPDVEMLPAGNTRYRLSNAISWLANETGDERRKLELQETAGSLIVAPKLVEAKAA